MVGSEKTIELLLEYAIEIEYKAAQIYGTLSKLFPHVPGLSDFWQGLKEDELGHVEALHETRKLLTPKQLLQDPGPKMWEDVIHIQLMLGQDLLAAVNTLDDAYELAHELEFSEVNAIFQFLAAECIPFDKRKRFIHSMIEQHQQKLSDFNQNFGNRDWRKRIGIQRIQCKE